MPTVVRQARSEATRRRIITAALQVFSEIGYAAAGLGAIVERADMTKGALYYHFASKEALATAIIEEGGDRLFSAFRNVTASSSPALEKMLHGSFVAVDVYHNDGLARGAVQLMRALGEFNTAAARVYGGWLDEMSARAAAAVEEGDLKPDLDPRSVGETLVGAVLGAELLAAATSSQADMVRRIAQVWEVLLPAVVTDAALPYFREYLARESLRYSTPKA